MQTYQTRRKTPGRKALPGEGQDISKSEMLHLSGAGAPQPMSPQLREKFEPGFNADFSNIRISRGHIPEEMGVQAVAQGTDILLDESAGMDVLGHELAHVVQQAQGRVDGGFPVVENAALEQEADVMGQRVASGLTAQAGSQNGFGGEMMSIAPMSSASAPAQCKSKEEKQQKKDAKTMQKITDAEQRRDAAIAGGANARGARKALADEMEKLVNGMSQRQLQSPAFQDRIISMAAGPINREIRQKAANDDGSEKAADYGLVFRGSEHEPEMRGMNTMAQRLLGLQKMADVTKSRASAEQKVGAAADQLGANPSAMRMMKTFKQQAFAGVDRGVMSDDTVQSNLMANNFLNRIFGSAGLKLNGQDMEAKAGSVEMQRVVKTDPKTGQFSQSIPEAQRLAALFADPAARAAPPQPAPPQAAAAPVEAEEPNSTQEMQDRMEQATINQAIPRELFDEMTDERGHLLDTATIAARANAASPSYTGMKGMFNEDKAAMEASGPSYQGMREMFNERRAASEAQTPNYSGVRELLREPKPFSPAAETTYAEMRTLFNPALDTRALEARRDAQAAYQESSEASFSENMRSLFCENRPKSLAEELGLPEAPGEKYVTGLTEMDDLFEAEPEQTEAAHASGGQSNQMFSGNKPPTELERMMNMSDEEENELMKDVQILDPANDPPLFPEPAPAPAAKKKNHWWQFWR